MLHLKLTLVDPISPILAMKIILLILPCPLAEMAQVDTVQFVMPHQEMNHQSIPLVSLQPIIKSAITINSVALRFDKEKVLLDN